MNAFSDLLVTFGDDGRPDVRRLGNPWRRAATGPGGIWTSRGPSADDATASNVSAGEWTLWASGDVFAYRDRPAHALQRFAQDLTEEAADPANLDMHAVVIGWDERRRQVHVWVDRMGTTHVYLGGRPGRRRLGTPFSAVAEHSAGDLDWVGITGFCGFGFYPADRTPLEDVRILRPATHTVLDESGHLVTERRYWNWSYDPVPRSDDDLVDGFREVWRKTLARQTAGHSPIIPVSGGLDSRTIVADLTGEDSVLGDVQPALFTYGYSRNSVEIRIAKKVARARQMEIESAVVEPYLFDRLDDITGAIEGFVSLTLPRQVGASELIAPLGDRVVGGHWGDVWFDSSHVPPSHSGQSDDLTDVAFSQFAKRGREWLFDNICRPHLGGQNPDDLLRDVLSEELARIPDLGDTDMRLKALKTEQWSFRWTLAGIRAYHLARPTLLPFYGNDIVDFFMGVPSDLVEGRLLQIRCIQRHHRDLSRVQWQASGLPLCSHRWDPFLAICRRASSRAARYLRSRAPVERNWEVQYAPSTTLLSHARSLTTPESSPAQIVDDSVLQSCVRAFVRRPEPPVAHPLDVMMTLRTSVSANGHA